MGRGRGGGRRRRRSKKEAAKAKEEEEEETSSSSIYIPEEIILSIFLLLPTESLLRFRFVSKRWYCLISPHVKQKVIFPYRKTCLHRYDYWCRDARCCAPLGHRRPFRSIDQTTLSHIENIDLVVVEGKQMDITPCQMMAHVCGSCNGLLLIKIGIELPEKT